MTDLVKHLQETEVVAIVTRRQDDTPVVTPIWAVVIDGVPYLRAEHGPVRWYRQATSGRTVEFALGDGKVAERDTDGALAQPRASVTISVVTLDDPVMRPIDDAFAAKYGAENDVSTMVEEPALSATLRVDPDTVVD